MPNVAGRRVRPTIGVEGVDGKEAIEESTWEAWRGSMAKTAFLQAHGDRVFATSAIPCEPYTK